MIEVICLLIGRLLLLLVGAYELLWRLRQRLYAFACGSYDYWRGRAARERHERSVLEACREECTKLPQHLVIVIAPDEVYVDKQLLKRIFGYALVMGMKHISVYDKREPGKGYVDLSELGTSREDDSGNCFSWPALKTQTKPLQNGYKVNGNGFVNGVNTTQLKLYQISSSDGHALIADVCRELYEQRKTPLVQELLEQRREALTDHINSMLNKRLGFVYPEPELGLVFARQTCTYGLLPWHVRFTEFHTHPSGCYFNVKSFADILYRYARCEQRWGK